MPTVTEKVEFKEGCLWSPWFISTWMWSQQLQRKWNSKRGGPWVTKLHVHIKVKQRVADKSGGVDPNNKEGLSLFRKPGLLSGSSAVLIDVVWSRRQCLIQCPTWLTLLWGGKFQALVYDILPSTSAIFSYAIGSRKLSANEQFFVGAQTVASLLQTIQIKQGMSFIATNKVYTSTNNHNRLNWHITLLCFFVRSGCVSCLHECLGARLLPQSY